MQVFTSFYFKVCIYHDALNHCIILFVEESIRRIEVSKILSLNLELFGIDVKGLVGHRGMTPAVKYLFW